MNKWRGMQVPGVVWHCKIIIKASFTFIRPTAVCKANYESSSKTKMIKRWKCERESETLHCTLSFPRAVGIIRLSLLLPVQPCGEFQPAQCWVKMNSEITAYFGEVYGYVVCSVLQEGMWEFWSFQLCHPSHTDKLFGQLKLDHTHTLPVTWVWVGLFVLLLCGLAESGKVERARPLVRVCAFMKFVMSLCCFRLAL